MIWFILGVMVGMLLLSLTTVSSLTDKDREIQDLRDLEYQQRAKITKLETEKEALIKKYKDKWEE